MSTSKRPSRRTLLGGLLAATGLAGTGIATKLVPSIGADRPHADDGIRQGGARSVSARFFVERYTMHTSGRGAERQKGDQTLLRGTLRTANGDRAGEIFATAITMPGPIDDDSARTPRMETQNLHLKDGTILAMGTVFAQSDIPNIYTVVGGTGAYAGARGTYRFDHNPLVARPDGQGSIALELTIEPAADAGSPGRLL